MPANGAVIGRAVGLAVLLVLTFKVLIFGFLGELMGIAGGSLPQVLIPVVATLAFLRTRQYSPRG